ncbi:hypothetical protein BLOT_008145 [Blomia tropicalis]|nr:hypothetical protein BLOT_008145 [Blomia tropicalis]
MVASVLYDHELVMYNLQLDNGSPILWLAACLCIISSSSCSKRNWGVRGCVFVCYTGTKSHQTSLFVNIY